MLSDVVRRGLLGKFVEDILRQPRRKVFGHVTAVVWVGAGLAAFDRHTSASIRTGQVGREVQIEEVEQVWLLRRVPVLCGAVLKQAGGERGEHAWHLVSGVLVRPSWVARSIAPR